MTDVIPIDKQQQTADLLGRLLSNTYQANAGAYLVRDLIRELSQIDDFLIHQKVQVACNGLLAATSFLMEGIDDITKILEVPNLDWDALHKDLPLECAIRMAIEGGAS